MRHSVAEMRVLAEAARRAADGEPLDNVRAKHLAAADKWEALARQSEAVLARRAGQEEDAAPDDGAGHGA